MESIAHIREKDKTVQTVEQHLHEAKALAEGYGSNVNMKHICGLAALLHDAGKLTEEFRNYILKAVNDPEFSPKRGSVDHSTAGGKLLFDHFHTEDRSNPYYLILAEVVGNAIISHHSYLHDYLDSHLESPFLRRVRDKELTNYDQANQLFFEKVTSEQTYKEYVTKAVGELEALLKHTSPENYPKTLHFITKFVFSTLIDADRTNTRLFEENKKPECVDIQSLMSTYYDKLVDKLNEFQSHPESSNPINQLRASMSDQCDKFAEKPSDIYTLSIPTGGGKTLASLRYALKHAKLYKKKRIIYIVPFTTIIEQNAQEVRDIIQDEENILEHHSNVMTETAEDHEHLDGITSVEEKLRLAKDNWGAPIIFTTMVQFLNVFYEKGSRNVRRLHRLSDAVIIFDEVQKVPVNCISLFNESLNFLKNTCKSSIVLCTATQPALDFVDYKLDVPKENEMIKEIEKVNEAFKRTTIIDQSSEGPMDLNGLHEFVTNKVQTENSLLVILNTKSTVKDLYLLLKESRHDVLIYHLSTSMCAAHRKQLLKEIRERLDNNERIICVTTQLIEAGVDVDFDCVIRSIAGLDSIAQAAGRCNRHGKKEVKHVYLIDCQDEKLTRLKEIQKGKDISRKLLKGLSTVPEDAGKDILSHSVMERYFQEFYTDLRQDLDYHIPNLDVKMTDLLFNDRSESEWVSSLLSKRNVAPATYLVTSYRTAAEHFKVIDNLTTSVLVPYQDGEEIIADLNGDESHDDLSRVMKKAQHYTINIYSHQKQELERLGALVSYLDGSVLVLKDGFYDQEFGLDIEDEGTNAEEAVPKGR